MKASNPHAAAAAAAALGQAAAASVDWRAVADEVSPGIFAFDLFTPAFCALLVAEADAFEGSGLPRRRPNTMNNFGLIVNEIGLEPLMSDLVASLLGPACRALFPEETRICGALDHHHSFLVQYRAAAGGDTNLDMHHDASEATLNVCLGRDFAGAGLRFCGRNGSARHRRSQYTHAHVKGRAVLHLGRHRHGADDIAAGDRLNLIVWLRSSTFRGAAAFGHADLDGFPKQPEAGVVDHVCLSAANDADYEEQLEKLAAAAVQSTAPSTS